jgi:hypothetical protein
MYAAPIPVWLVILVLLLLVFGAVKLVKFLLMELTAKGEIPIDGLVSGIP